MRAIVRTEYGGPDVLRLEDIPVPTPGEGEVLVRVRASSVNMADVDYMLGRPRIARLGTGRRPRNTVLGLDVAGVVEAVGSGVTRLNPGDEVFGDLTNHGFGAYAEYACAAESAFAAKPPRLSFEEAAAVPQAAIMALQGLRGRMGTVSAGDNVLINGAGGTVGPFAIQIAKAFGAQVTGVDHTHKLDLMRSVGADRVLDYTVDDYTKLQDRYHWILDMAPHRNIFAAMRALTAAGVYLMIPGNIRQVFKSFLVAPTVSVFTRRKLGMPAWRPFDLEDVAFLTKLIEEGKVRPAIDRTYELERVPEALGYQMEQLSRGKLVITID